MNMLNVSDVKWIEEKESDIKALSEKAEKNLSSLPENKSAPEETNAFGKMKAFVKKAVDCCIE